MKKGMLIKDLGYYVVVAKPNSRNWIYYYVYEASKASVPNKPKQWYLRPQEDLQGYFLTLDQYEEAFYTMSGCVAWRGVWDVRLYFNDTEYFDSDFDNLHKVYTQITELLKEELRSANPEVYE